MRKSKDTVKRSQEQNIDQELWELEEHARKMRKELDYLLSFYFFVMALLFGLIFNIGANYIYDHVKKYQYGEDITFLLLTIIILVFMGITLSFDGRIKKQRRELDRRITEVEKSIIKE